MDKLRAMHAFVAVVQNKSFAVAAERLNVSPSIVSKQVAALEELLGIRLLNRTTRRVEITDTGQHYYESCVKVLTELESADESVRDLQRNPSGTITLRAPHSIAVLYLRQMIAEFSAEYPEVKITLIIDEYPAQSVTAVERGSDLALHLGPTFSTSLAVRELAEINWYACASPRYLRTHSAPRHPQELLSHNCLVHLNMAPDRRWHFEGPNGAISVQVSGSLISNSSLILRDAALSGVGIAMLPTFCTAKELTSKSLVRLLGAYATPQRNLSVLFARDRKLPSRVRLFLDFMATWFKNDPWERDPTS
jgi:DNA-binding transcriptional LysR family regulator